MNFKKFQTKKYDSLPQGAQKRLTRMDQMSYVQQLEAELAKTAHGTKFLEKTKSVPQNSQRYYRKNNQMFSYDEYAVYV